MHLMKQALLPMIGLTFVIAASTASYIWLSREIAPTQKILAQSQLPSLIPLKDIHDHPNSKWGHSLSDSGKWLAWKAINRGNTVLRYRLVDGNEIQEISPKGNFLFAFNDHERDLYVADNKGLWIIDPKNPEEKWLDVTPKKIKKCRIRSFPKAEAPYWYFLCRRPKATSHIYRQDLNGKNLKLVDKNDGTIFFWGLSPKGEGILRYRRLANGNMQVETYNGDGWHVLLEVDAKDRLDIVGFPETGKPFWAISNRGRDKIAAVSIDPNTGKETVIYENPRVDASSFFIDLEANAPAYVLLNDPYFAAVTFNDKYKKIFDFIIQKQRTTLQVLSGTRDGKKFTVAISENEEAFRTYLIDVEASIREKIGNHPLSKYDATMSKTEPVMIKARDGLELPLFLTLPKGVNDGPLPMVLLVHGGPAFHDFWGFDHNIQFLANRGYAVLRVNFRGSTGYGRKFQEAGFGEMGRKIQDDLDDAVKWAIAGGIADPDNIAIMGTSYGGYAALTAAWKGNGLYKAAIAYAAVSDMTFQTENYPKFWTLHLQNWTQYTGDPQDAKIRENLDDISPINHVEEFNIPLLLIHGTNDRVVDVRQSKILQEKLEKIGKDVQTFYLKNEGHGLSKRNTTMKFWREVEVFLAEHLGGRSEGIILGGGGCIGCYNL